MDSTSLTFNNFERLSVSHPVDRLDYIAEACRGKVVLDIGCLDETALVKKETKHWLHGRIAATARSVVGIDNSMKIPDEGIRTGSTSKIIRVDGASTDYDTFARNGVEVVVAGEFIEHIEHPLAFFRQMRASFRGGEIIMSTPNGASLSNLAMAMIGREVQHPDHIHCYTFKTLHTMCMRAGFEEWEIIPYRFSATEMILNSRGPIRWVTQIFQSCIRAISWLFPLTSYGYIVRAKL